MAGALCKTLRECLAADLPDLSRKDRSEVIDQPLADFVH